MEPLLRPKLVHDPAMQVEEQPQTVDLLSVERFLPCNSKVVAFTPTHATMQ